MTTHIRPLAAADIDSIVEFSLRAWAPVFASFEQVLGAAIYSRVYPDWRTQQAEAVESICRDERSRVWVAEHEGRPVGFAAVVVHEQPRRGEIEMLAVDPDLQGAGIGTALTEFAVQQLRRDGTTLVEIGTGGDPGHAPARRTYEKAGFTALPLVRYYRTS